MNSRSVQGSASQRASMVRQCQHWVLDSNDAWHGMIGINGDEE